MRRIVLVIAALLILGSFAFLAAQETLAIPAEIPINFSTGKTWVCWKVLRPADGRITAEVIGPGTWNVCIGDRMCPDDCMSYGVRRASTELHTQGTYYFVKVETATPGVAATLRVYPTATGPSGKTRAGDSWGEIWDEVEGPWKGTWVRRGTSEIFDAKWAGPSGQTASDVLTMTFEGRKVTIRRKSLPTHVYSGYLQDDGTVSGSATDGRAEGKWSAVIRKKPADPATASAGGLLGRVWEEIEGDWKGTWTRRGDTAVFDAVWVGPGRVTTRDVLTMTLQGRQVTIKRQGLPHHVYTGLIDPSGKVSGTASDGRSTGRWSAVIR